MLPRIALPYLSRLRTDARRFAAEKGLSSGVPVVTLPADFVRGRFALAMYKQMGYTDLVAEDIEVRVLSLIHI